MIWVYVCVCTWEQGLYRDSSASQDGREVYRTNLKAGERIIWKRWLESQNQRQGRRSRLRAPCCGKSTLRFRLLPDDQGFLYCQGCWDAFSEWQHNVYAHQQSYAAQQDYSSSSGPETAPPVKRPPWREPAPPGKRQEMTAEDLNSLLLGIDAVG